jgi:hypothetical protein
MKSTLLILVVFLLSVILYNRISMNFPLLHQQAGTECVVEAKAQIEDNCSEDESINGCNASAPFSFQECLSKTQSPPTILGMVSLLWQPPK